MDSPDFDFGRTVVDVCSFDSGVLVQERIFPSLVDVSAVEDSKGNAPVELVVHRVGSQSPSLEEVGLYLEFIVSENVIFEGKKQLKFKRFQALLQQVLDPLPSVDIQGRVHEEVNCRSRIWVFKIALNCTEDNEFISCVEIGI